MDMRARIEARLTQALAPLRLEVIDESHRHEGHAGARPGGGTHFRVEAISTVFTGKTRVQRQRIVHGALEAEFADGVHALSLQLSAPEDDAGARGA